jgi:hypothetical protein
MAWLSPGVARVLATIFLVTTLVLAGLLVGTWAYVLRMTDVDKLPAEVQPALDQSSAPVSPLMLQYQLDLPGRGEVFPALAESDNLPLAVLTIANTSDKPVLQTISAELPDWSHRQEQTVVIGSRETRQMHLEPELLARAFQNNEIRRATLEVRATSPASGQVYAASRRVLVHSVSDIYWGKQFANAQFVARWVTPHDEPVLKLVSEARKWSPGGRLAGYNSANRDAIAQQVRSQVQAVFKALQKSGISYVSSIFTFGNFSSQAQRIRLPRETLSLSNANCMDVSVVFASAMENLGMHPVIVIVPGHAFAGVRLGPQANDILYVDLTVLPNGTLERAIARAEYWRKKTPSEKVLTVDVAAARALGIYPM